MFDIKAAHHNDPHIILFLFFMFTCISMDNPYIEADEYDMPFHVHTGPKACTGIRLIFFPIYKTFINLTELL